MTLPFTLRENQVYTLPAFLKTDTAKSGISLSLQRLCRQYSPLVQVYGRIPSKTSSGNREPFVNRRKSGVQ